MNAASYEASSSNVCGDVTQSTQSNIDPRLKSSLSTHHTSSSLKALYDDFAKDYESACVAVAYDGPQNIVNEFCNMFPQPQRGSKLVLDAGCGTGLVGEALQARGFKHIVGIDFSDGMLAQARSKLNIYERLHKADLSKPIHLLNGEFDAVICSGVFAMGHVGKDALRELVRVTKRDGIVCFGYQEYMYKDQQFEAFIDVLEKQSLVKRFKRSIAYSMRTTETKIIIVTLCAL